MGGINSTRWAYHRKKMVVEDCVSLDVDSLLNALGREMFSRPMTGSCRLTLVNERTGRLIEIDVEYASHQATPRLRLNYQAQHRSGTPVRVELVVELQPTQTNFGGLRYWFLCPSCHRRVGKLYLPKGRTRLACRQCHGLTYCSVQRAHMQSNEERLRRLEEQFGEG
jgi:hypothetical protein